MAEAENGKQKNVKTREHVVRRYKKGESIASIAKALGLKWPTIHYHLFGRVRRRKNGTIYVKKGAIE